MKYYLGCLGGLLFAGISFSANLYNLNDAGVSETLEQLNQIYHINTDIHILNTGDTCANRQDFAACIRKEYDDGVDLIFVINNPLRKMETSIRDSLLTIIPKAKTLNFEQAAVPGLQNNNTSQAISAYLSSLTQYIKNECSFYETSECTSEALTTSKILYEDQQAENRARQTVRYLWTALTLILATILLIGLWSRRKTTQRNKKNKALLNQLVDHTKFLSMSVEHDTHLTAKDKKNLQKEISTFETELESLSTSSPDRLHMKLREESYQDSLETLTNSYQDMLKLLGNSKEILAQLQKIKDMNI